MQLKSWSIDIKVLIFQKTFTPKLIKGSAKTRIVTRFIFMAIKYIRLETKLPKLKKNPQKNAKKLFKNQMCLTSYQWKIQYSPVLRHVFQEQILWDTDLHLETLHVRSYCVGSSLI